MAEEYVQYRDKEEESNDKMLKRGKGKRQVGNPASYFTLPPSALSTASRRMDPYLSVLNYACHNSIMKQRKDGQPWN